MGAESAESASTPPGAVFLSYASQDAQAAQRVCAALRLAGVEVWFDQSELRGGDAWDRQIRERIHDCRLFIALISAPRRISCTPSSCTSGQPQWSPAMRLRGRDSQRRTQAYRGTRALAAWKASRWLA